MTNDVRHAICDISNVCDMSYMACDVIWYDVICICILYISIYLSIYLFMYILYYILKKSEWLQ